MGFFFTRVVIQILSDHPGSKKEDSVNNEELRDLVGGPWPRHPQYDGARARDTFKGGVLGCKEYVVEVRTDSRCNWLCHPLSEVSGVLPELRLREKGGWWRVLTNVMTVHRSKQQRSTVWKYEHWHRRCRHWGCVVKHVNDSFYYSQLKKTSFSNK